MAITPSGSPAWVRNAAHTTYGGHTDKRNWQSQGLVNGRTDVGAEAFTRAAADLAAIARTAPLATLRVTCNDSSPAAPTIEYVSQMTGIQSASYGGGAAPTGYPSASRNGDGDVTITWPTTLTDDYGVSAAVDINTAIPGAYGSTITICTATITSNNVVRVRSFDAGGSALADAQFCLEVG